MLDLHRRDILVQGGAALATMAAFHSARSATAFPTRPGDVVIPWLDQPPAGTDPCCDTQLVWEELDSWVTPNHKFFAVSHFDRPVIDAAAWKLAVDGLVEKPLSLSLADLKARPRQETFFTLECSGNHGFPDFVGARRQRRLGRHAARRPSRRSRGEGERHRGRRSGARTPATSSFTTTFAT